MNSPTNDDWPAQQDFGESVPETTIQQRGRPWLAWFAIVATIGIELIPHSPRWQEDSDGPMLVVAEIQARYLIGMKNLPFPVEADIRDQIDQAFGKGTLRQRLVGIVLIDDLTGPGDANTQLASLQETLEAGKLNATDQDRRLIQLYQKTLLARLAKEPIESTLTEEERAEYRKLFPDRLKWVGSLAIHPKGSGDQTARSRLLDQARRTVYVSILVFSIAIAVMACGAVLQVLWWSFLIAGRLTSQFGPIHGSGAIYAETFAVWLILYLILGVIISSTSLLKFGFIVVMIPQAVSLMALAWPVWRGISWSDVRHDIGLHWDREGLLSPFLGLGSYLAALPLLAVAMVITVLMMKIAASQLGGDESIAPPAHPIVEPVLRGNWTVRWQLLLVAVFAAVPEEIMFRGVLYRHLRQVSVGWGYVAGVAFAAMTSGFVFAVIHPQGVFGIPVLMTLAIVFAVVREWRGSLVPCMIAHGMVNAVTFLILNLIAD